MGRRLGWLWRRNLPLILQLLAALAAITALAGPALLGVGSAGRDLVVVMDLSASMKAAGESGSRFDAARAELLQRIGELGANDRMMIIGAGAAPEVVQPFTRDRARLGQAAEGLAATDAEAPVKEAVLLAHTFLKRQGPHRVVVITDGAFKGIEELPLAASYLELAQVGGGADNVGILGFQFRRVAGGADEYEAMVVVENFTERPVHAPLIVTVSDRVVSRTLLSLEPFAREVLIYGIPGPLRGRATALLAIDDDLHTDNRAFLAFPEERPTRVLYVGPGNPFLERLLRYFPHVTLARIDRIPVDRVTEQVAAYDVVILDRVPAPPLVGGNFVLIRTVAEGLPLRVAGQTPRPARVSAGSEHPLVAGVRLDGLYVRDALELDPGGGVALAESERGPLIHAVESGDLKALVFAFDLTQSDLPFRVSFPLLVRNAFAWFRPTAREFPASQVSAGLPFVADVGVDEEQLVFVGPSGESRSVRVRERAGTYTDTAAVGFYRFQGKRGEGEFAVNLFSEEESRIRPSYRAEDPAGAAPSAVDGGRDARFDLWPVLLVVALALLLAECVVVCRTRRSLVPLWLRVPALAVLLVALVNPRILAEDPELDVVMAVDLSHSVGEEARTRAVDVLERAQGLVGDKVRLGVFSFARRPQWEFLPTRELPVSDLPAPPERDATDLGAALQGALGELSEGRQSRILLISDANENRGAVERVLPLLRSHGVAVWPYPVSLAEGRNEVYLSELTVPSVVDSGETFEIKAALTSARATSAGVTLLRDGRVIRSTRRELAPGANWLSFTDSVERRGTHTYELMVEAATDVLAENNLLQGIVSVEGPSRVLYLHGAGTSRRFMAEALQVQGYEVVEKTPARANLTLPELSGFDLLILDNVPAYQLSQVKMERIERFVRDLGGGLIVLGGTKSYGAGGYYRTPLEQTLPVEMRPPVRMELPHVALLFVVDKSGSMGGGPFGTTKLDLAKAATMASAELLNPTDEVAILAFDSNWQWVVPFRRAEGGETIAESVARLSSDGGTDLLKAMVEGRRALAAKEAAIKHVLVLSDGLTEKADLLEQVTLMGQEKISVSTVSIGGDADRRLMTQLAESGSGRSYATVDPRTIPQIFTTETLLISRDLLVEKTVTPTATGAAAAPGGPGGGEPGPPAGPGPGGPQARPPRGAAAADTGLRPDPREARSGSPSAGRRGPVAGLVASWAGSGVRVHLGCVRSLGAALGAVAGVFQMGRANGPAGGEERLGPSAADGLREGRRGHERGGGPVLGLGAPGQPPEAGGIADPGRRDPATGSLPAGGARPLPHELRHPAPGHQPAHGQAAVRTRRHTARGPHGSLHRALLQGVPRHGRQHRAAGTALGTDRRHGVAGRHPGARHREPLYRRPGCPRHHPRDLVGAGRGRPGGLPAGPRATRLHPGAPGALTPIGTRTDVQTPGAPGAGAQIRGYLALLAARAIMNRCPRPIP